MNRPLVRVTRRLPPDVEAALAAEFAVELNPSDVPLPAGELHRAMRGADALLCTVTDRLDADVIGPPPVRCRLLANFGVGYNHIDLAAARAAGIAVTNTPGVLTDATADLTMALILVVARRMGEGERLLRRGEWRGWTPTQLLGRDVAGARLGIIGFGRIGQAVAQRAPAGFGMEVRVWTPRPNLPAARLAGAEPMETVDELVAWADFVSLHCPSTPETRHLIDARRLALMRREAFLVNTARGDVVDEVALVKALQNHTIAGAALDVYEGEPRVPPELAAMENVVLLPHLGSATREARTAMGLRALRNLSAFFAGRDLPDRVA